MEGWKILTFYLLSIKEIADFADGQNGNYLLFMHIFVRFGSRSRAHSHVHGHFRSHYVEKCSKTMEKGHGQWRHVTPQAASLDNFFPYKHDASGSYSSFKARVGLSGHGSKAPTSRGRTVSLHTVPYARLLPQQLLKQKLIIQSPLRFPKTVVPTVLCLYLY